MFNFWSQGLRIGDCLRLKWGNIQDDVIVLTMEKTQRELIIPLNSSNIHRIKWYMDKYYPIWNWKTRKWNDYYEKWVDLSSHYDLLYSHETGFNEFLQMIEHEKELNFSDFESKNTHDVERFGQDRYGVKYHQYIMDKFKPLFEFLNQRSEIVNKELLHCIQDYSSNKSNKNNFIFPFLKGYENKKDFNKFSNKVSSSVSLINKSLREVGKICGINKKFSNHWSRHTITSISRGLGVDMYELKTWLGHTSVKTTETYVNTISTHSSLKNSKNIKELLGKSSPKI
jgi:integrase